jgi:beta-N-acetylhexosaminidase
MVSNMRYASLVLLLLFLLPGPVTANEVAEAAAAADRAGARWAERTLRQMSLEEKVGQLFMIKAQAESMNPAGPEYTRLRDAMQRYHLGGFLVTIPSEGGVLQKASPLDAAALTNQLQRDSPLPLIFAADFERGLRIRFHGGTGFPHAMAFGAAGRPDYAYRFGRISAEEARAIGIHWNFYPDADVNSNPANPIINTRAFGEDPAEVGVLAAAFIRGVHDGGGLSTAKHFPGHGDTDTDSHLALSRVAGSRERLDRVELAPFRAAIAAGVDSIMVGHLLVPALEPDPDRPATISSNISTRLLRDELGFQGLIVTDAMDMNGVTRIFIGTSNPVGNPNGNGGNSTPAAGSVAQVAGRAAVEALKAGADLILIPADLDGAYNGVLDAVKSGELNEARIDRSASRLLRVKAALRLHRDRFVDLNAVLPALERPENVALAQQVADDALTVVRLGTSSKLLPLPRSAPAASPLAYRPSVAAGNRLLVLVFTDDVRTDNGRELVREIRWRVPDARIFYIDDALAPALAPQVLDAASRAERIVAALYVIPSAGRAVQPQQANTGPAGGPVAPAVGTEVTGSPALAQGPAALLASLLRSASAKTAVVALGNPYLITQYPAAQNYICTFSNAPVSELSAVKFLFGEIPARGHLPITIPGVAERVPMQPPPLSK